MSAHALRPASSSQFAGLCPQGSFVKLVCTHCALGHTSSVASCCFPSVARPQLQEGRMIVHTRITELFTGHWSSPSQCSGRMAEDTDTACPIVFGFELPAEDTCTDRHCKSLEYCAADGNVGTPHSQVCINSTSCLSKWHTSQSSAAICLHEQQCCFVLPSLQTGYKAAATLLLTYGQDRIFVLREDTPALATVTFWT